MAADTKIDPRDPSTPPPNREDWPGEWKAAYESPAMEAFREGLRRPGCRDIRESVLTDLGEYLGLDPEACVKAAVSSKERDAEQWGDLPAHPSAEQLKAFYQRNHSWVPGLLWYSYLQAEGYAWPVAVSIANDLMHRRGDGAVLDFGSGVGSAALMFHHLGYKVSLADISSPLLEFARYRAAARSMPAEFIDLRTEEPPASTYHAVVAIQTMAHVPDVRATATVLHRSLLQDGYLYADFDTNERNGVDSRLYDDDLPLRRSLQGVGFEPRRRFEWGVSTCYQRTSVNGLAHSLRVGRDALVLGPPRRVWRALRR